MKMQSKPNCWISLIVAAAALAGTAGIGRAQAPAIVYNFTNDLQGWSGSGDNAVYSWNATGGSAGGGCMQIQFGGTGTNEIDPWVTLPSALNEAQYLSVSIHMLVDPASGTTGSGGSGGFGNLQAVFRSASYSWDSIWYGGVLPPAANNWVTYNFVIPQPYQPAEKYLQFQLQGNSGTGYTAPVTVYVDNVTVTPLPDPYVLDPFTSGGVVGGAWDSSEDAPFTNPINHTVTNFTPAGSWKISIANPGGYSGWNQYQPSGTMDLTRFQYLGFDVFLDGSTGTSYGGAQLLFFQNGWGSPTYVGGISFNAGMVGKWTHFDIPSASMGSSFNASPAFSIQGTPGGDGGTNTTTFHVDNLEFWSPVTLPAITGLSPGTPGGVQMSVDNDGTTNQYDQEGITSPVTNNVGNFFWIYQTPAIYSFSLTNFPSPASSPGFDAHVYLVNGDSITATAGTGGWSYNETYSGVPYNAVDYAGLRVENGTNGGVVAIFEWKTNAPSSNPPTNNTTQFSLPSYTSANGTWALNFSDNTHLTISGPGGAVGTVTLPDFANDPNYTGNFTPGTSLVQFGVAKHDVANSGINNGKGAIFTGILVTNNNAGTVLSDTFSGPGLNANNAWQIAEYYLDPANRIIWQPQGTAWWMKWNSTQSGWSVQSTGNLPGGWSSAGVTYTYVDGTGTNTLGAIPSASLPPGNAGLFRLTK